MRACRALMVDFVNGAISRAVKEEKQLAKTLKMLEDLSGEPIDPEFEKAHTDFKRKAAITRRAIATELGMNVKRTEMIKLIDDKLSEFSKTV